jgi:hypothetical protein
VLFESLFVSDDVLLLEKFARRKKYRGIEGNEIRGLESCACA